MLLTLEDHLLLRPDGHYYVAGPAHYSAWTELLDAFDEVVLFARVTRLEESCAALKQVDGPGVSVYALPDFTGPWHGVWNRPALTSETRRAVAKCGAFLIRAPGIVGRLAWKEIRRWGRPFGAELLGDPWDVLSPGSVRGLLRPIYRRLATREMKQLCASAACTLYWTRETLQRRYPPRNAVQSFVAPRIALQQGFASDELVEERLRRIHERNVSLSQHKGGLRIGYLGTFAQLYKGPDTLLRALARCRASGLEFRAFLAGEGKFRQPMEALARQLSIERCVTFLGQLQPGCAVSNFLDSIDLFVMPSRQEGLPRAFVEAMARGCPCIGTREGARELLDAEDLVSANEPAGLAEKILSVAGSEARVRAMSLRNLERARQFQPEVLRKVRLSFYRRLHALSPAPESVRHSAAVPQPL